MKSYRMILVAVVSVFLSGCATLGFGGVSGYNIVVINGSGLDVVIEKVESGSLKVVGKAVPGKEIVFGVGVGSLEILGSGIRSATYLVKGYYPGTDRLYGIGQNIVVIKNSYRSTSYYSTTWTATTTVRGTHVRKSSRGPRVYNHPPGWYGGGGQHNYNYVYNDTITVYIGDGVDPAPIAIHNKDFRRAALPVGEEDGDREYQSY